MTSFTQDNGFIVEEKKTYKTRFGELARIEQINHETNQVKVYNISDSCNIWHRIDSAIKDNKFKDVSK
jgi:hypothetical protein